MTAAPATAGIEPIPCDREPIHVPGAIQPHGALLAFEPKSLCVLQVAGDTQGLVGVAAADLLGASVARVLGPAALARLQLDPRPASRPLFDLRRAPGRDAAIVDAVVHRSGGLVVLELEARPPERVGEPVELVQAMLAPLAAATTSAELMQGIADAVRTATGFGRVMVYRFAHDDSGAVAAESRRPDLAAFMGQHFPATDIPLQARALYRRNWLRAIRDARYAPAPLQPPDNPLTGAPLDLTDSVLRSVSPVHLEYLANMGVVASMSLSLVVEDRLWGLVACHDDAPRAVSLTTRTACELFAQLVSLQLADVLASEAHDDCIAALTRQARLIDVLAHTADPLALAAIADLVDVTGAVGAVIRHGGRTVRAGTTPEPARIDALVDWLAARAAGGVFVTDRLPELFAPAAGWADVGSGLLAASFAPAGDAWVLWFRPEVVHTLVWAGDPASPKLVGDRPSPRASFAAWRESVRGRALPWRALDVEAAEALRLALLEHAGGDVADARRAATSRQEQTLADLDARVAATVTTLRDLAGEARAAALEGFTHSLQRRLRSLMLAHGFGTVALPGGSLGEAVDRNLAAYRIAPSRLAVAGPPVELGEKASLLVGLVLHELGAEAIETGALSTAEGRLDVSWSLRDGGAGAVLHLVWNEIGGPPPVSRPERGRRLLTEHVPRELGGHAALEPTAGGLRYTLELPLPGLDARA